MASRIKGQGQGHKADLGDYRYTVAIFSAVVFLGWMVLEITLGR